MNVILQGTQVSGEYGYLLNELMNLRKITRSFTVGELGMTLFECLGLVLEEGSEDFDMLVSYFGVECIRVVQREKNFGVFVSIPSPLILLFILLFRIILS